DVQLKAAYGPEDPYNIVLEGVDFRDVDLRGVVLVDALLCDSQLQRSDLFDVTIKNSNLSRSNLTEATMISTTLVNCDLTGVDFSRVTCGNTIIIATDLSHVKNLATATHKFPSSISIDTLEKTVSGLRSNAFAV